MSKKVPPDRFPTLAKWLFPVLDFEDQLVIAKGWATLMSLQIFAVVNP
jgi:hypothetical protein